VEADQIEELVPGLSLTEGRRAQAPGSFPEMKVAVGEAGKKEPSSQIDDPRLLADPRLDRRFRADGDYAAALDGERSGPG
jgi:hypothetical protein